jgi:hypothetical protein
MTFAGKHDARMVGSGSQRQHRCRGDVGHAGAMRRSEGGVSVSTVRGWYRKQKIPEGLKCRGSRAGDAQREVRDAGEGLIRCYPAQSPEICDANGFTRRRVENSIVCRHRTCDSRDRSQGLPGSRRSTSACVRASYSYPNRRRRSPATSLNRASMRGVKYRIQSPATPLR